MVDAGVLKVKLLRAGARAPSRATAEASGWDIHACLETAYVQLGPDVTLVPTGVALEAPAGYDLQVRPRSGLGRQGVNVVFGTIDADYRGEIFVSMYTFGSKTSYRIENGDRVAQLVVARVASIEIEVVSELSESSRGEAGHGSTGR
jgi:dUTP pyrophosphatase